MQNLRNENAILVKRNIELEADNKYLRGELKGIERRRLESTSDRINLAVERRFAIITWLRERILAPVLANVVTVIVMAILYLAFGGKLP